MLAHQQSDADQRGRPALGMNSEAMRVRGGGCFSDSPFPIRPPPLRYPPRKLAPRLMPPAACGMGSEHQGGVGTDSC